MNNFDIQSVKLEVLTSQAYDFIAKPQNLPKWTNAFKSADEKSAIMETPMGGVEIKLITHANPIARTIDWEMIFPDGTKGFAYSRVTADNDGSIYSFILMAPPVPLEHLEGALSAQKETLSHELVTLKSILENL